MAVTSLFPVLRTRDLPALASFYERAFGGEITYRLQHEGSDVYVAMTLGGATIGIGFEPDVDAGDAVAIWIYVDDTDAAYAASLDAGGESVAAPEDRPWGERVAEVRDPEGNLLYLGTAAS